MKQADFSKGFTLNVNNQNSRALQLSEEFHNIQQSKLSNKRKQKKRCCLLQYWSAHVDSAILY